MPETFDRVADVVLAKDSGILKGTELNRQAAPRLFDSIGLSPIPLT